MTPACATTGVNKGDFNLMSAQEEKRWGDQFKGEVDKQLAEKGLDYSDPVVSPYIDQLGQKL